MVVPRAPSQPVTKFGPNTSETKGGYYPRPDYPPFARKNNYQGTCKMEMLVDTSGAVTSVKVIQSSGYPTLDQAALQVVKNQWRFPPGSPRHFWYPFVFELIR